MQPVVRDLLSQTLAFSLARRKNMSMRMAVKTSDDKTDKIEQPEVHGRLKSDITYGKEKIYERSYY